MSSSTAAAAFTVVSDSVILSVFITFSIISITVKNLFKKFFTLIMILIEKSHLKKSRLHENAAIKWHCMMNRKTTLGQGRDLVTKTSCKHCNEGHDSFEECVMLSDHLGGSCCNCHYNSSEACCLFHDKCKLSDRLAAGQHNAELLIMSLPKNSALDM